MCPCARDAVRAVAVGPSDDVYACGHFGAGREGTDSDSSGWRPLNSFSLVGRGVCVWKKPLTQEMRIPEGEGEGLTLGRP